MSRIILIVCRIQKPEIANALKYNAVNDIPVAALIVALTAVRENPVTVRNCDRMDVSVVTSDVSAVKSADEDEYIRLENFIDRCWMKGGHVRAVD